MINIASVEWKNFMGYGDYWTKISFDNGGIYFIYGQKDDNPDKRNAIGKSSIIQAIVWGLFGNTTFDEQVGDKVVNWHTGKNCVVRITTLDGYEIIRTRKHNSKNETIIRKIGDEDGDLTRGTNTTAQETINSLFNIDYYTLKSSEIFGQLSSGFMNLTESKRRQILERFMKMGIFSAIAETAKEKSATCSKDIEILQSKVTTIESEVLNKKSMIGNLKSKEDSYNQEKASEVQNRKDSVVSKKLSYDSEVAELDSKISSLNEKLNNTKVPDVQSVTKEWNDYNKLKKQVEDNNRVIFQKNTEIISLNNQINSLTNLKSNIDISRTLVDIDILNQAHASYNKILQAIDDKSKSLSELKSQLRIKNNDIKNIDSEIKNINEYGPICDACNQKISDEYKHTCLSDKEKLKSEILKEIGAIQADISKLEDFISKANVLGQSKKPKMNIEEAIRTNESINKDLKNYQNIENDIKIAKDKIELIKSSIPKKMDEPVEPLVSIAKCSSILESISNDKVRIADLEASKIKLKEDFKQFIIQTQEAIKKINLFNNPYTATIVEINTSISDLDGKIANLNKEINEKKILMSHINYIRDSYGNKKKIRAYWISKLIPFVNQRLRYYLDIFEIEDKIQFDEYLNIKSDRWDIDYHSGGEQMRVNLSLMFSLHDLHISVFGSQSNIMILDEVDGALDASGIDTFSSILSDDIIKRNDGPKVIMVISHRLEMKDKFSNKISVKNNGGRALIEYE